MKKIEISDLNQICSPAAPQYGLDRQTLAFSVIQPDQKENSYRKNIWIMEPEKKARQLTHSEKDGAFIWDDVQTLLFISERDSEKDSDKEKEETTFYRINIHGGEARKAFTIDRSVQFFKKLSDGCYCMGISENQNALPVLKENEEQRKEEKDYHVIDEVPLWGNARGFISGVRTVLYLYRESDHSLKRVTPPDMDVSSVDVREKALLIVGKQWKDVIDNTDSLLLYHTDTEETDMLINQGELMISNAVFAGGQIILTATDGKAFGIGQYHDIYRYDETLRCPVKTAETGRFLGSEIMTDCCYGAGESMAVSEGTLWMIGQRGYETSVFVYEENELKEYLPFHGMISGFTAAGDRLAFTAMEANGCCEVYEYVNKKLIQRTELNKHFLEEHFTAKVKYLPFTNKEGISIDGWVLEPENFDPAGSYPGVLEIHGGPRCTYGEVFFHEMQIWAAKGWFVFFCNPRGSEGYGEDFADLRGKYGSIDYEDLMAFTDYVLEKYPQIDRKHLGAAGGSYGGFMCNWIEGHTDRFAAIASQRSVSNWVSDFGTSEIGVRFDTNEMEATPWSDMEKMWDCSPLKYACYAKTPILFIHSLNDFNCTPDQGIQMFTAVKYYGVPARMCLFEGENHSLSRNGRPLHRMRRLKEMTDWFEKYLTEE